MARKSSAALRKEEVEKALQAKAGQIERRLTTLQQEVTSIGPALREAVFAHPLVSVGGALLAGLLVGLVFGGRKRGRDPFGVKTSHRALLDRYLEAVEEEVRHRVAGGREAGEAVREALRDRAPVIIYESDDERRSGGLLRQALAAALTTALGYGLQQGLQVLLSTVTPANIGEASTDEAVGHAGPAEEAVPAETEG